jgi:hypothetical protein
MRTELHPAAERGHENHGWLDTYHNFSFAEYFNPIRDQFGALRVLNDDVIQAGSGFGEHPHKDMEIISIPLSGALEHRDSMGHIQVLRPGDVQVMSAGTGIMHSEYNHLKDNETNFLQIWIYTREKNKPPRYGQLTFDPALRMNQLQVLVTPDLQQQAGALWIHQDAWISISELTTGNSLEYRLHREGNRLFAFVIEGLAEICGQQAGRRDAVGITGGESADIIAIKDTLILLIEVPER